MDDLIFERVGLRWLIDEMVETGTEGGTTMRERRRRRRQAAGLQPSRPPAEVQ